MIFLVPTGKGVTISIEVIESNIHDELGSSTMGEGMNKSDAGDSLEYLIVF
jgi:hypothetical protein